MLPNINFLQNLLSEIVTLVIDNRVCGFVGSTCPAASVNQPMLAVFSRVVVVHQCLDGSGTSRDWFADLISAGLRRSLITTLRPKTTSRDGVLLSVDSRHLPAVQYHTAHAGHPLRAIRFTVFHTESVTARRLLWRCQINVTTSYWFGTWAVKTNR